MSDEIFHHRSGGFPLAAAAYLLDGETLLIEVAIGGEFLGCTLEGADVQRFARAVADARLHYHWPGRALPRQGTLYDIEVDEAGDPLRVAWWWAGQDGIIAGADARAFLRSAGVLKRCAGCAKERLIAPELSICSHCGYHTADSWERTRALLEGRAH
jgi:hypothetical protein